jgi:hypothetical protein
MLLSALVVSDLGQRGGRQFSFKDSLYRNSLFAKAIAVVNMDHEQIQI